MWAGRAAWPSEGRKDGGQRRQPAEGRARPSPAPKGRCHAEEAALSGFSFIVLTASSAGWSPAPPHLPLPLPPPVVGCAHLLQQVRLRPGERAEHCGYDHLWGGARGRSSRLRGRAGCQGNLAASAFRALAGHPAGSPGAEECEQPVEGHGGPGVRATTAAPKMEVGTRQGPPGTRVPLNGR